jgi:hypothetical protein
MNCSPQSSFRGALQREPGIQFLTQEKTNGIPDQFSFVCFAAEKKIFWNDDERAIVK